MSQHDDNVGPSMDELRQAGVEAHVTRLGAEVDRHFSATWRGRLVWRFARWYAWRTR